MNGIEIGIYGPRPEYLISDTGGGVNTYLTNRLICGQVMLLFRVFAHHRHHPELRLLGTFGLN